MRDRLAAALLTLTRAEFGLPADQQRSIKVFWDNFDGFMSDFLVFEQDNSEYELQKLARDRILSVMKQNHETHLSNKQLLEALTKEEEELTKRLEEVKTRKEKLISDWDSLIIESERMPTEYAAQEKKLAEAEEKKRIAEEMMSRSTAAWSSLKAHFLKSPVEIDEQKQYPNLSSSSCQRLLVVSEEGTKHPNAPPYEEYIRNRQDDFIIELSKLHSYDEVVERVAHQVDLDDSSKIRLTSHNCSSQQPKPEPIRYRSVQTLEDMLIIHNQASDILYYEVLATPLPELEGLKGLKLAFHNAKSGQVVIHKVWLPIRSTVADVLNELRKRVPLSRQDVGLRLLEVLSPKICEIVPPTQKIGHINDQSCILRVEEIPEEEKNLGPREHMIHAYHFRKEVDQNLKQGISYFGEPFVLKIHEHETVAEVKVRLRKKLQVSDVEFSKWRFAFELMGRREYLKDADILWHNFKKDDTYEDWAKYLGLEHPDDALRRAGR